MNEKNYYLCFVCVRTNHGMIPCNKKRNANRKVQLKCPIREGKDRSIWLKVTKNQYEGYLFQGILE